MKPLPNLHTALENSSWHHLFAIARAHGLRCSNRWSKQALINALVEHLSHPDLLSTIIPQLPPACHDALQALLRADGSLPYRPFTEHFGEIRPYRPWRKELPLEEEPWRNPTSPLERLWYLGLVFAHPPKLNGGVAQRLYLPAELAQQLNSNQQPAENTPAWRPLPRPGQPPDLLWHVAIYLATAVATPLPLQHGRWPSPSTVATLVKRLGLDQDPTFQHSRSEKRIPYLAFLHYLAQAAELVTHTDHLHVTPLGWHWLQTTPAHRRQRLWLGLQEAASGMATAYAFPWLMPGAQGWSLLLTQLATLSTHNYELLTDFVTAIQVQDQFGYLREGDDTARLSDFLVQPLHWLGLVDLAQRPPVDGSHAEPPAASPPMPGDGATPPLAGDWIDFITRDSEDFLAPPPPAQPVLGLRLTAVGAWLLGLEGWGAPPDPIPRPAVIRRRAPDTWHFGPDTSPAHLAHVALYTTWAAPAFPDVAQRLTLDGGCIGRAVAAGVGVAQIFHHLQDSLARPLSRRQGRQIRQWAQSARQARIRTVTLLETADAALMGKLRSRRHSRALLGAPLSPTRAEINPQHLTALVDHLATLDLFVSPPTQTLPPAPSPTTPHGDGGIIYLALRLLMRLGDHLPLPLSVRLDQIDELRRSLSPHQLAAADLHVQAILEELEALLSGYLRLPAWRIDVDNKDVWPRLQRALQHEESITIHYWNAEQTTPSQRRITPYYIETRRHVHYLHAYCHLRQQERIFRVDRIERIETE
jgi:hypothetical protein